MADPRVRASREIVIADKQGGSVLAVDLRAGAADPALVYGYARLGTDTLLNGGFDNLAVMSTAIAFDGPLNRAPGRASISTVPGWFSAPMRRSIAM